MRDRLIRLDLLWYIVVSNILEIISKIKFG